MGTNYMPIKISITALCSDWVFPPQSTVLRLAFWWEILSSRNSSVEISGGHFRGWEAAGSCAPLLCVWQQHVNRTSRRALINAENKHHSVFEAACSKRATNLSPRNTSLPQKQAKLVWIRAAVRVYEVLWSVAGLQRSGCGPGGHHAVLSSGGWREGPLGCHGQPFPPSLARAEGRNPTEAFFWKALWALAGCQKY